MTVQVDNRSVEQNIRKRAEKYRYFVEQMNIDKKYRGIIQNKV